MKIKLTLMMVLILVFGSISVSARTLGDLTYSVGLKGITIDRCDPEAEGDIVIPEVIDEKKVIAIRYRAFQDCKYVTSVSIPSTVQSIGGTAFRGCAKLKSVNIPYGVTVIEEDTFRECRSLESVHIPDSVTRIEGFAFCDNPSLESVYISKNVEHINSFAFDGCVKLKSVNIPSKLKRINLATFRFCAGLETVVIPDGVEYIGDQAFAHCINLKEISIPDSVTKIDLQAFEDCFKLEKIKISQNLSLMDYDTFVYTEFYNNVNNWSNMMLYLDSYLIEVMPEFTGACKIREGTTAIVDYAFSNSVWQADGITALILPKSLKHSGYQNVSSLDYLVINNPETELKVSFKGDTLPIIYGYKGSTAEKLAEDTGCEFVPIANKTYSLTYEGVGKIELKDNLPVIITEPPAEKEGYDFFGWSTNADGNAEYKAGDVYTDCKSITLYPVWKESSGNTYADVNEKDWFYATVKEATERGIFNGMGENTFAPDANLTRAMLVTLLYRLEGCPDQSDYNSRFTDVAKGMWYTDAISWAKRFSIVNGVTKTEFAPDDVITREQLATIMYRYAVYRSKLALAGKNLTPDSYVDINKVSDYAKEAICYSVAVGIMNGKTEYTFCPGDMVTRAEAATVIVRFLNVGK